MPLISSSVETFGTFKQNECVELIQSCSNCTYNNITSIVYPNSSKAISGEYAMTKSGTEYNFTFCNTSAVGRYIVNGHGDLGGNDYVWAYDFEITPTGKETTTGQGFASIGIIISIVVLIFIFSFYGFKFLESDKTFPIGLFFLLICLILVVYDLYVGYIMTRDVFYSVSLEPVQFKVWLGIMWGLIGIAFLGLLSLTIKAIKEIRERKSLIKYGEGWNPKTKQYEY